MKDKCLGIDCAWCASTECPNEKKEGIMACRKIVIDKESIADEKNAAECEFYMEGFCDLNFISNITTTNQDCVFNTNCYYKQLKRKEQELKQYKASKQASYEAMQRKWNEVEQENRKLKARMRGTENLHINLIGIKEYEIREVQKHKQALEKIEKICKEGVYDEYHMPLDELSFILTIINEVLKDD